MRKLAVIVGVLIIGAATHVIVMASGGYQNPHAPLAIAIACGVALGSICIGVATRERRYVLAFCIALCLLAGEAFTMLSTAERVVVAREAASEPARLMTLQRTAAQKRVDEAKAAIPGDTSSRIAAAQASQQRAESAVATEAAKKGCASNCRALLNKAVDDAQAEMAAARAALEETRRKAQKELGEAEAALAAVPAPKSETPLADKLGMQGWTLDLLAAGLASLAANGLGAALLAFGAHGGRHREATPAAIVDVKPERPVDQPAPRVSNKDHAAKFGVECLEAADDVETSLSEIGEAYLSWCKRSKIAPLKPAALGSTLATLFDDAGLPVRENDGDLYVTGVRVRRDVQSLRVIPHMPQSTVANGNQPAKMKLRTA